MRKYRIFVIGPSRTHCLYYARYRGWNRPHNTLRLQPPTSDIPDDLGSSDRLYLLPGSEEVPAYTQVFVRRFNKARSPVIRIVEDEQELGDASCASPA